MPLFRRFKFSWKISLVCGALALLAIRLSYWQSARHQSKLEIIRNLAARLDQPVRPFTELYHSDSTDWGELPYRRVQISGSYDFAHEMVLRNRRLDDLPGVYLLTPLKLDGLEAYVIVERGFVPLVAASRDKRAIFQDPPHDSFVGLVKADDPPKFRSKLQYLTFLEPPDPPAGPGNPWVDAWLRIDLQQMQRQLPYPILPIFVELIDRAEGTLKQDQIVRSDAGREEIFMMPIGGSPIHSKQGIDLSRYPTPQFSAVVPAGRHLGYIYEWAFLALLSLAIGYLLQLRRD